MDRRHWKFLGLALGLALALGLVYAASAVGQAPAPRTIALTEQADDSWVSGWVDIDPGETLTFTHDLGGDPGLYGVELWFLDGAAGGLGANYRAYGGVEDVDGNRSGAYWSHLTDTSIRVTRNAADPYADRVRLRIWQPDPPDYDSGWLDIAPGETLTLTYDLPGDVDDYTGGIKFRDNDENGLGVNHFAFGGMESVGVFLGGAWFNLTDTAIQVQRFGGDETVDQVRVVLSVPDSPPDFDSGWVSIDPGQTETIDHNLGGNPGAYVVRTVYRSEQAQYGVNVLGAGGLEITTGGATLYRGAYLSNLTDEAVNAHRHQDDHFADEVRVRIWAPKTLYLPVVMREAVTTVELAYDDGGMDSSQSHDLGSGFAVRFTPPGASASLLRARYYFQAATGDHPIEVHVWDASHNDLITPFEATPPAGDGWYEVDLSSYNLTVNGDFYVGFLYAGTESHYDPSLGADTNEPLAGRSYEVPWVEYANNYMIRVVVEP